MFRPEGTVSVLEEERGTERGCFVGSFEGAVDGCGVRHRCSWGSRFSYVLVKLGY